MEIPAELQQRVDLMMVRGMREAVEDGRLLVGLSAGWRDIVVGALAEVEARLPREAPEGEDDDGHTDAADRP